MCGGTEKKVMQFLSDFTAVAVDKIHPKTDVARDLGVDGDDAIELLDQFSQEFDVDLSDLDGSKYFEPEQGWNPIVYFWMLASGQHKKNRKEPMYVQYLIDAADRKAWK